jgi:hypothetical protein
MLLAFLVTRLLKEKWTFMVLIGFYLIETAFFVVITHTSQPDYQYEGEEVIEC